MRDLKNLEKYLRGEINMLVWADNKDVKGHSSIFKEISAITPEPKDVTIGGFKVWELPFVHAWLERLSKSLNLDRKVRVMDFGCGRSPFPEFLVSKGFEVWGVDDNSWKFMNSLEDSGVNYWVGDVLNFDKNVKFDAIVSCSVFEHIISNAARIKAVKKLKSLLHNHGKMLHVIDFYYPEMRASEGISTDFYAFGRAAGFDLGDLTMCPGAPDFNFDANVRNKINLVSVNKDKPQSRIAIGNDI